MKKKRIKESFINFHFHLAEEKINREYKECLKNDRITTTTKKKDILSRIHDED